MNYYLIDTSAFVYAIEHLNQTRRDFFAEKAAGMAFLYMPQFCVTEVFNTYARLFYRENRILGPEYNKWRSQFIRAIHNRRIIYCYDLHRYHNLNAHGVYKVEHRHPLPNAQSPLSGFDILVIAMGMELMRIHEPNEVSILTRDGRLHCISNLEPEFPKAIWFE